jgi:uncharacterized protein (TIGR03083 family)
MSDWSGWQAAYAEASAWFVQTAGLVGDRWSAPGLGEWDVRALVGHTTRSLLTVESGLANPPVAVTLASAVAYYQATRTLTSGAAVAQRGRDAGAALGDEPAAAVAAIVARVLPLLEPLDGSEPVTTAGGGMRIADYLPTRVFELTVHTADLAVAIGVPVEPPAEPALRTLTLISQLAIADGRAATLLLATTGRQGLPPDFSVL